MSWLSSLWPFGRKERRPSVGEVIAVFFRNKARLLGADPDDTQVLRQFVTYLKPCAEDLNGMDTYQLVKRLQSEWRDFEKTRAA